MIDHEKFGCQAPLQDCDMTGQFNEMHTRSGLETFNIAASDIMKVCINAQKRLREIADFHGKTYDQLLGKYSSSETGDCPVYVLTCEERSDIPTLPI